MKINQIFYSIQGEGVHTGVPTVFVRLQGCNLISHCSYCDTLYAQDFNKGNHMEVDSIVKEVINLNPQRESWVCITGGEPVWQLVGLLDLVKELKKQSYLVTVETNGSLPVPSWYPTVDSWNADMKCPSSGVCGVSKEDWFNLRQRDQVKFVVGNKEDLDFARQSIKKHLASPSTILVSPVINLLKIKEPVEDYQLNARWLQEVAEFCKEQGARYSLQIHKILWGDRIDV